MYAKSLTTINNIIEAAQRLFVEKNYKDVTVSEIAQAATVTKGALYHHFESKEMLYLHMMHSYLGQIETMTGAAVASNGTAWERVRKITLDFLQMPAAQQAIIQLVRRDINIFTNPQRQKLVRAYQQALPDKIQHIIEDGIHSGEIIDADPRLLAWQHVALVEVVLTDYARQTLGSPEDVAAFVMAIFYNGAGI